MRDPQKPKGLKMWWKLLKMALDKNGSPGWNRVKQIMSIYNMSNSAKSNTTSTYTGAVTNNGMYGSYGG